ncbi:MAG TPA: 2OG-Fe(II) oxygenase, partial [Stellaceae bacterium]|nr:2OG-Fe(II) oxygenase [Stellaceae bacterium]
MKARSIDEAPGGADWAEVTAALEARGYATVPGLLAPAECRALRRLYDDEAAFRSRVVMARHGFGRGEYKYLRYPLPPAVERLRQAIYPRLAPIANRWREALGEERRFPAALDDYLAECHAAGQTRPTPLILKYGADDYNCLHQDLYGALVFPLQLTV